MIKATHGLRQGSTRSLLLFTLVVDCLSRMLMKGLDTNHIEDFVVRNYGFRLFMYNLRIRKCLLSSLLSKHLVFASTTRSQFMGIHLDYGSIVSKAASFGYKADGWPLTYLDLTLNNKPFSYSFWAPII